MGPKGKRRQRARKRLDVSLVVSVLESEYGSPRFVRRFEPMEELVSCILSQHTADANSFPAFTRLRETFQDWQAVVDAGWERVAEVVRKAGLANQKAKSIVGALEAIHRSFGDYSLDQLGKMSMEEAKAKLIGLPGVGPKTAAIVLCFGFGMPAIPVDTHVHRVSLRLGLIPPNTSADKAHDLLLESVPSDLAFRFHVALIQHGRLTCRAPFPNCPACVLAQMCPSAKDFDRPATKKGRPQTRKA